MIVGSFIGDPSSLTQKHIQGTEGCAACQEDRYIMWTSNKGTKGLGRSSKDLLIILHTGTSNTDKNKTK